MEKLLERINKAPTGIKAGVMAAVVIVLTASNYFLLVSPEEDRITQLEQTKAALEVQLAEKKEIAQNLTERRKELDSLDQQLQEALTELPERKDIDELLAQLNDVGKKSGLEIAQVAPGNETNANFYAQIPIKMTVSGNYHEIALFMQEIANMRRIVNVNNIKLGQATMKGEKVVLTSDFLATTFRFVDQGQKPGTPKPQGQ
ncbi:MAG: type 4a pilus biogenesis protein PilO [Myxococcaceae bacterium]